MFFKNLPTLGIQDKQSPFPVFFFFQGISFVITPFLKIKP